MGLLVFAHVDGDELFLAAVQHVGQGQCGFGLAYAAGAYKEKHAFGFVGVVQVGARGAHTLGHRRQGMVLADDAHLQRGRQAQHGFDFVFDHFAQGDAGPAGYDFGHHRAVYLHRHQGPYGTLALQSLQLLEQGLQFLGLCLGLLGCRGGLGGFAVFGVILGRILRCVLGSVLLCILRCFQLGAGLGYFFCQGFFFFPAAAGGLYLGAELGIQGAQVFEARGVDHAGGFFALQGR